MTPAEAIKAVQTTPGARFKHWLIDGLMNPDSQVERFVGILTLTRVMLVLPYMNPLFPTEVYEFVRLVPQSLWGWVALLLGSLTLFYSGRDNALLIRIWVAYTMGAHWFILAILFLLGDKWIPSGWFCLVMCLGPLSVICRLHSLRQHRIRVSKYYDPGAS